MNAYFSFTLAPDNESLDIKLNVEEFDFSSIRSFKQMLEAVWKPSIASVQIDMKGVKLIDSPGVGGLIGLYKRLGRDAKPIRLINVDKHVVYTLALFRLESIFHVEKAE